MSTQYEITVTQQEIKKEMSYQNQTVLTYTIQYPKFASAMFRRVLDDINRFYKEKAEKFQRYCERKLFRQAAELYDEMVKNGFPFHPYEAMLVYTVTYNQNCALSLYFDQYEYTGGAHGATVRSSETWNIKRGGQYALRDFFPYSRNYKAYILRGIDTKIARQIAEGTNQYFDDHDTLASEHFNEHSFYITPDGVVVYYQQYDIAPYASGIVEFVFPYEKGNVIPPSCRSRGF